MTPSPSTLKHLFGLFGLSVALCTELWTLAEDISRLNGRLIHLAWVLPPLDLGFMIVSLVLNPGSALGALLGIFLFWIL